MAVGRAGTRGVRGTFRNHPFDLLPTQGTARPHNSHDCSPTLSAHEATRMTDTVGGNGKALRSGYIPAKFGATLVTIEAEHPLAAQLVDAMPTARAASVAADVASDNASAGLTLTTTEPAVPPAAPTAAPFAEPAPSASRARTSPPRRGRS